MAKQGPEPRRAMAKAGAVEAAVKDVTLALVGPAADVALARRWLARLNGFAVARESNSRRYRDWPGAKERSASISSLRTGLSVRSMMSA